MLTHVSPWYITGNLTESAVHLLYSNYNCYKSYPSPSVGSYHISHFQYVTYDHF